MEFFTTSTRNLLKYRHGLAARNDPREVVIDPHARYFGAELGERSLIPAADARLGEIRFEEWLHQPVLER